MKITTSLANIKFFDKLFEIQVNRKDGFQVFRFSGSSPKSLEMNFNSNNMIQQIQSGIVMRDNTNPNS